MTEPLSIRRVLSIISTHTPLARRDGYQSAATNTGDQFLLTRLLRGVTFVIDPRNLICGFLLTRLLRGVT